MAKAFFREIMLTGRKSSRCVVCNKRRCRGKTFRETLNKIDTNKDGRIKTRSDIMRELEDKITLWKKEPINCCE